MVPRAFGWAEPEKRGALRLTLASSLLALVLLGCAPLPSPVSSVPLTGEAAACRDFYAKVDEEVERSAVSDAEGRRIPGFPYLRMNRTLASLRHVLAPDDPDDEPSATWIWRLAELDQERRVIELANLPPPARAAIAPNLSETAIADRLRDCRERLIREELRLPAPRRALLAASRMPDAYADWQRLVGLYPVTALGVRIGYLRYRAEVGAGFDAVAGEATDPTDLTYYAALETTRPEQSEFQPLPRDALGLPRIEAAAAARLALRHAPVFAIASRATSDRPGRLRLGRDGPLVDPAEPRLYWRISAMPFAGLWRMQIVYSLWFPERPATGPIDIYAGRLDQVVWRVTLDEAGHALIHDTMHGCGCYHLFFPVPPVQRQPMPEDEDMREEALTPRSAPVLREGERLIVRLQPGSHQVVGLAAARAPAHTIRIPLSPDAELASLPLPEGGRRSPYRPDGLLPESRRLERFLLWPMGIPSAGAMRQWGNHATAFIGERHFDDPDLLDRAFRP